MRAWRLKKEGKDAKILKKIKREVNTSSIILSLRKKFKSLHCLNFSANDFENIFEGFAQVGRGAGTVTDEILAQSTKKILEIMA